MWQMSLPWWPDGMATGQFSFNSDVVCRTSSHIWGRWYLPIFLFRDGSLTLMNKASFIALVRFWSSLPTIVKLLMVTSWPEVLLWSNIGEGAFWCSLNLSAKFLADSPIYSSVHPWWLHLNLYMTPLLFFKGSLSLGAIRRFFIVWPPLKNTWTPNLLHDLLILSLSPWWYGTTIYKFLFACWPVCLGLFAFLMLDNFLEHLNSINPSIQVTCEETREDGSMPFLDILVTPADDGSLQTSVFRKITHTDLYLQWDSHHTIPSKYSVAGTLFHRASTVCSTPNCCKKRKNTFSELSPDASTQHGP